MTTYRTGDWLVILNDSGDLEKFGQIIGESDGRITVEGWLWPVDDGFEGSSGPYTIPSPRKEKFYVLRNEAFRAIYDRYHARIGRHA